MPIPEPNRPSQYAAKKFKVFRFPKTKQPMQIVTTPIGVVSRILEEQVAPYGTCTRLGIDASITIQEDWLNAILAFADGRTLQVVKITTGGINKGVTVAADGITAAYLVAYAVGTVDTTAGSPIVTANVATSWANPSLPGLILHGGFKLDTDAADSTIIVDRILSNTQLRLAKPYGATAVGATYTVANTVIIYDPQAAYAFDEPSYWVCEACGLAIHKKDLAHDPVTGKFVCPLDYNHLGVHRLEAETGYMAAAIQADADDFVAVSEWP